jgi:NitT/TauT family transport system substrate-binding protein
MVGKANGWFGSAMGPQVKVQWTSVNPGPSAIEALFAGAIDMTYVGQIRRSMVLFVRAAKRFVLFPAQQAAARALISTRTSHPRTAANVHRKEQRGEEVKVKWLK